MATVTDELPFDDEGYDVCYECSGLGDDYEITNDGELECRCFDCPFWGGNSGDE